MKTMDEIEKIAKDVGIILEPIYHVEPITAKDIKPLLDMELGNLCKRCDKWFGYAYTQEQGELPVILNGTEEYCSKLCKEKLIKENTK